MFTNTTKYAVKALCILVSESSEDKKLLGKEIAKKLGIPNPFLSKILQSLSRKHFISSTKGRNGGFYLTSQQLSVSVLTIILELEGKDRLGQCIMNFENCNLDQPCPIHEFVAPAKTALRNSFEGMQLKDLGKVPLVV